MTSTRCKAAVDEAVGELGRLDIVVANAGICSPAPWDQITAESFRDTIDTNVTGTWNTVMASAQHIIDGGRGGSIILIGSAAGIVMEPFMIHYVVEQTRGHRDGPRRSPPNWAGTASG